MWGQPPSAVLGPKARCLLHLAASRPVELRSTDSRWRLSPQGLCWAQVSGCVESRNSVVLSAILLKGHGSNWQAADGLGVRCVLFESEIPVLPELKQGESRTRE